MEEKSSIERVGSARARHLQPSETAKSGPKAGADGRTGAEARKQLRSGLPRKEPESGNVGDRWEGTIVELTHGLYEGSEYSTRALSAPSGALHASSTGGGV